MNPDPLLIRDWYKSLKAECTCPICEKEGLEAKKGNVEFHHIDPRTKTAHMSNLVYKNLIHPDSYAAVRVAVEFMKCGPICPSHHKEIHQNPPKYDLVNDPFYRQKLAEFRTQVLETIPPTLYDKVLKGVMYLPVSQ